MLKSTWMEYIFLSILSILFLYFVQIWYQGSWWGLDSGICLNIIYMYSMSRKSWPNLYSSLVYKMGQDILDRQYICLLLIIYCIFSTVCQWSLFYITSCYTKLDKTSWTRSIKKTFCCYYYVLRIDRVGKQLACYRIIRYNPRLIKLSKYWITYSIFAILVKLAIYHPHNITNCP